MTDLPQPIYPTPGPGGGTRPGVGGLPPGPPSGWPAGPPGPPSGPPPGPGGPWGAPSGPPPGPPSPKRTLDPIVLVVIALVVVGAIVGGVIAFGGSGDDDAAADKTTTTRDRDDAGNDDPDPGGNDDPDPGGNDDPEPDGDLAERAETVAAAQIDTASESTLTCWADELANDTDLLDLIEPMAGSGTSFDNASDAEHYASFIMLCAPPSEVQEFFLSAYAGSLTESGYQCLSDDMDLWTVETWEEWVATVVQPDLASSADEYVEQVTGYC